MNSLFNAVILGALSVIFSAGLHAETHQHGEMSTAAQATPEQVIAGTGVVKAVDLSTKKSLSRTMLFQRLVGPP